MDVQAGTTISTDASPPHRSTELTAGLAHGIAPCPSIPQGEAAICPLPQSVGGFSCCGVCFMAHTKATFPVS